MSLGDKFGKPLYELIPDVFPHGRLTQVETALWGKFYEERVERRKQHGK